METSGRRREGPRQKREWSMNPVQVLKRVKAWLSERVYTGLGYKKEFRFMGFGRYLSYGAMQRLFRINGHVSWPVHWSSVVSCPQRITFGREINPLGYSPGSYIQAINGVKVGTNVIHAVGLTIISSNHDYLDFKKHVESSPVCIGDNCWLGANVTLLPGVELGPHTIVAAGSVVTKSFPGGDCVIGGIPAKVLKQIPPYAGSHYFLGRRGAEAMVPSKEILP